MALDIRVIAHTVFRPEAVADTGFRVDPEGTDAANLSEFSGRACYQSYGKPNPATATAMGYHKHIIDVGHLSVFEHGTVSLLFNGISRSFTHELVRHRHFSYSQLSQRYCPMGNGYEVPPLYQGDEEWQRENQDILSDVWSMVEQAYEMLVDNTRSEGRIIPRKQAREAARAVLPNMTTTQIVVSGNHRSWREFIQKRATVHADAEIRAAAVKVFELLSALEPALYQDMSIVHRPGQPAVVEVCS